MKEETENTHLKLNFERKLCNRSSEEFENKLPPAAMKEGLYFEVNTHKN